MYGSVLPFPLSIRQPERDGLGVPVHGNIVQNMARCCRKNSCGEKEQW